MFVDSHISDLLSLSTKSEKEGKEGVGRALRRWWRRRRERGEKGTCLPSQTQPHFPTLTRRKRQHFSLGRGWLCVPTYTKIGGEKQGSKRALPWILKVDASWFPRRVLGNPASQSRRVMLYRQGPFVFCVGENGCFFTNPFRLCRDLIFAHSHTRDTSWQMGRGCPFPFLYLPTIHASKMGFEQLGQTFVK